MRHKPFKALIVLVLAHSLHKIAVSKASEFYLFRLQKYAQTTVLSIV